MDLELFLGVTFRHHRVIFFGFQIDFFWLPSGPPKRARLRRNADHRGPKSGPFSGHEMGTIFRARIKISIRVSFSRDRFLGSVFVSDGLVFLVQSEATTFWLKMIIVPHGGLVSGLRVQRVQ